MASKNYILLLVSSLIYSITLGQSSIGMDNKVTHLLSQMTLEEKIGQMNQYNGFWEVTGPTPKEGNAKEKYEHLKKGWVGSVLNVRGVENVRKLQEIVVNESRLGIPLLFGSDVIHGYKTLAPIPLAESASWDLEAIKNSARIAAIEASATGINWTFAPMVDISRDPRWGRVMEGGGEDPFLGSAIAKARINGFQGSDLSANNTIAATAKHFAGYGWSESGREYNTTSVDDYTLYNVILPPFKAAVDSDVQTVMNSFGLYNGIPATGSSKLQRDILKDRWNFEGFVISDWASIKEMTLHGHTVDLKEAAEKAAIAGSDMDMESYAYIKHLKELVQEGKISEKLIDEAVSRILKVKFRLGLFEDPYKYCNETREQNLLYNEVHQKAALDIAKKSIVLLKNDNNLLPLQKGNKIAVIGDLADDKTSPLGSWRIGSDDETAISVLEGLDNLNIDYNYSRGCKLVEGKVEFTQEVIVNTTDKTGFEEAKSVAENSDIVIVVLGEHGFMSGEARSRTDISLPGLQQELLEEIRSVNSNVVLVLMNGRPLAIPWAEKNIPAIVETWQLGSQSGNAIAEVLTGKYNPSGKLPMTFPRSVGQIPIYYNQFSTGRQEKESHVFWSHYIDEENTPLWPFGYGLSYTEFEYSNMSVKTNNNGEVSASISLKNAGSSTGEEVVQLYIQDIKSSYVRPVKELKGFKKVSLAPGETQVINFSLAKEQLGYYTPEGKFVSETGEFNIMIGTNSQKLSTTKINIASFN